MDIGMWLRQRGCIGPKNKQEHESEIGKQDGRGRIQMNISTEMNITALWCPKDNLAEDRRVFRVLFAGTVLWYADVDTILTIQIIRGHTGIPHLGLWKWPQVKRILRRRIDSPQCPWYILWSIGYESLSFFRMCIRVIVGIAPAPAQFQRWISRSYWI